jgi:hypothetical protein
MSATAQQDHVGTKLSDLARQLGEKAREYEDLVRGQKTDEDRRLVETLKALDLTVNHPEKGATSMRSLASIVDELPEATYEAGKARTEGEAHAMLDGIGKMVGLVLEQV